MATISAVAVTHWQAAAPTVEVSRAIAPLRPAAELAQALDLAPWQRHAAAVARVAVRSAPPRQRARTLPVDALRDRPAHATAVRQAVCPLHLAASDQVAVPVLPRAAPAPPAAASARAQAVRPATAEAHQAIAEAPRATAVAVPQAAAVAASAVAAVTAVAAVAHVAVAAAVADNHTSPA